MKGSRFLWLELVGCALLLAVAYGIFSTTPDPVWVKSKGRDVGGATISRDEPRPQVTDTSATRSPAPPPRKPRPPSRPIVGELRASDALGKTIDPCHGTLYLRIELDDGTSETHALSVAAGRFQVDVPIGSFLTAETATIADRYAQVALPRTPLPLDGKILVTATLPASISVSVEEASTGAPIQNVTLLKAGGPPEHDLRPLGESDALEALGRTANSPLTIPPDLTAIDAWIDAPNYAFARLRFNPRLEGSQRVRLERAASLRVTLARAIPDRATVRLRLQETGEFDSVPFRHIRYDRALLSSNPLELERLRPSTFLVRLVGSGSLPPILAEEIVTLAPGRTSEIILDPKDEQPLQLRGTLTISAEWDPLPPTLRCFARSDPLDDWNSVADLRLSEMSITESLRSFALDAPHAQLRFELLDTGFARTLLEQDLDRPLELVVPRPARLELHFQDEAQRDVEIDGVRVHCLEFDQSSVLANRSVQDTATSYRVRIPLGAVAIELLDPRFRFANGESRIEARVDSESASLRFDVIVVQ